jgi:ribonucleoside-diphosphate reductase alpha chain
MAQSITDYIFRRLALDYLPFESRAALGIYSASERQRHLETGSYEPIVETGSASEVVGSLAAPVELVETKNAGDSPVETKEDIVEGSVVEPASAASGVETKAATKAHTTAELLEQITGTAVDSPLCFTCGTKMRPAGSCHVCEGCGSTSGCS